MNIKQLKEYIKDLPDEMEVWVNGENTCSWKISKDINIQDIVWALQTITK